MRDLLQLAMPGATQNDLAGLVEAVAGSPLAAWQAAGYTGETAMPVPRYIQYLKTDTARVLQRGLPIGEEYRPLAVIWERSFDLLREHDIADPYTALCCLKALGVSPVRSDFWLTTVGYSISGTDQIGDEFQTRSLVSMLGRLRLTTTDGTSVQGHRLLLDYVWALASETQRRRAVAAVASAVGLMAGVMQVHGDASMVEQFYAAVSSLAQIAATLQPAEGLAAPLLIATAYMHQMDYADLSRLATETLLESNVLVRDADRVAALTNLGNALLTDDQSLAAERVLTDTLPYLEQLSAPTDRLAIFTLAARVKWERNDLTTARNFCRRADDLINNECQDRDSGSLDDRTVSLLANHFWVSALLSLAGGDSRDAEHRILRALDLLRDEKWSLWRQQLAVSAEQEYGRYGFEVPAAMRGSADLPSEPVAMSGRTKLPLYRTVIMSADQAHDEESYKRARVDLAQLLAQQQGNSARAILRRAEILQHYARIQLAQSDVAGASETLTQAFQWLDDLDAGARSSQLAQGLFAGLLINMSEVLVAAGDLEKALSFTAQALEIDAASFGVDHDEYAMDCMAHALTLALLRRQRLAVEWFEKALFIWEKPGPSFNLDKAKEAREMRDLIRLGLF
jgi:tetratricopeptide (TPR) repeat protein